MSYAALAALARTTGTPIWERIASGDSPWIPVSKGELRGGSPAVSAMMSTWGLRAFTAVRSAVMAFVRPGP